jgi:phosphoglucomutase
LLNIYAQYGYSKEKGISGSQKREKSGAEEIEAMMKHFRENPFDRNSRIESLPDA